MPSKTEPLTTSALVLRTVYIPRSLDTTLRNIAFREERTKSDLIRELLQVGLHYRKSPKLSSRT